MIKITIHSGVARVINYKDKQTGEPKQLRAQDAYAFTVNENGEPAPFPEKFEFLLSKDQAPYTPGDYTLHPSAMFVDRNHKLGLSVRLAPVKARAVAASA